PRKGREGGNLIEAISARMFPTPTGTRLEIGAASEATLNKNSRQLSEVVAAMYPTPRADGRDNCGGSNSRRSAKKNGTYIGRTLNPEFVEWLMGFPIGWTDLECSAMPSCPSLPNGTATESSKRK